MHLYTRVFSYNRPLNADRWAGVVKPVFQAIDRLQPSLTVRRRQGFGVFAHRNDCSLPAMPALPIALPHGIAGMPGADRGKIPWQVSRSAPVDKIARTVLPFIRAVLA
jgi:hypothetical protein